MPPCISIWITVLFRRQKTPDPHRLDLSIQATGPIAADAEMASVLRLRNIQNYLAGCVINPIKIPKSKLEPVLGIYHDQTPQ